MILRRGPKPFVGTPTGALGTRRLKVARVPSAVRGAPALLLRAERVARLVELERVQLAGEALGGLVAPSHTPPMRAQQATYRNLELLVRAPRRRPRPALARREEVRVLHREERLHTLLCGGLGGPRKVARECVDAANQLGLLWRATTPREAQLPP